MALRYFDRQEQGKDVDRKKENILYVLNTCKIDIIFASFCILLISGYYYYISLQQLPSHDGAFYLLNARDWLTNKPLDEHYRPPLISWIIAGVWSITGEDWVIVKWVQPIFTIGAGIVLYILLRKYKGGLFAFGVTALTMTQESLFLASGYIQPEGLALFFLVLTIYLLKSQKEKYWLLAGITSALTFASRYPIFLQAAVIFFVETITVKKPKLALRAILGAAPILVAVVSIVYLKAGTFQIALWKDTTLTTSLSPFYLINSVEIWGIAFLLVPLALLQKRTYTDNFNYTFIAWFVISLLFWSSNSENHQFRFTIQFTPAVYFLSVLAIENIVKSNQSLNILTSFLKRVNRHTGSIAKSRSGIIVLVSFIASSIIFVLFFASFIADESYFEQQRLFPPPPPSPQNQESQQLQGNNDVSNTPVLPSVKITSPVQGQDVLVNNQDNFHLIGTSTISTSITNLNNNTVGDCHVSVIVNNVRPYQKAIPTGPNGVNDYSRWKFEVTPDYTQLKEGGNRISAKLSCPYISNDSIFLQDIKSDSVFITGSSAGTNAQPLISDTSLSVEAAVKGLSSPTSMAFLGENNILVLEKEGNVRLIADGILQEQPLLQVPVSTEGERGLLGVAVSNGRSGGPSDMNVFLYYTEGDPLRNRIYKYQWNGETLISPQLIVDLPSGPGTNHQGGKLKLGPDNQLYVIVGEMQREGQLQNIQNGPPPDDTGVIFRVNPTDGSPSSGNPFSSDPADPLSKYYAYGIRNSFGMDFDPLTGNLWDTENGPNRYDEINLVSPGFNSGWQTVMGPISIHTLINGETEDDLVNFPGSHYADPLFSWVEPVGPTDIEFFSSSNLGSKYRNNIFVGDINNGNLYYFEVNENRDGISLDKNQQQSGLSNLVVDNEDELSAITFGSGFGGITDIETGPDGSLYVLSYGDGIIYEISSNGTPQ